MCDVVQIMSKGFANAVNLEAAHLTRRTNGFSKNVEDLFYSVAIHFMNYNFCRIHKSLMVTPAMEAGIADHVWSLEDIVCLMNKKSPSDDGLFVK